MHETGLTPSTLSSTIIPGQQARQYVLLSGEHKETRGEAPRRNPQRLMSIRTGNTGNDLRLSILRRESRPKSGLVASGIAGITGLLRIFAVSPVGSLCNRLDIRLGIFLVLVDSPVKDVVVLASFANEEVAEDLA
jgi:hypothetical protein